MKILRLLLWLLLIASWLRAGETAPLAAVRAADDERVAAMIAADRGRLEAAFSDQLSYGHSSTLEDTKTSLIESLVTKKLIYAATEYKSRDFVVASPGVVLMKGHALMKVGSPKMLWLVDLNFLAVWREEAGHWRLLAWQSRRNGEITPLGPLPLSP